MTLQDAPPPRERRYRWIGTAVVIVALLGWFLAAYFWSARSNAEEQLARQIELTEEATVIEARIAALNAEAAGAQSGRDVVVGDIDNLEQERATAQASVAALQAEADGLTATRDALETELVAQRDEMTALETGIAEARQTVADTSQALSDVGARLEEARLQEVDIQATLATQTAALADLTAAASDAEARMQAAREAEASLEQEVVAARQALLDMQNQRTGMEQAVATLEQRQDQLAGDTAATEQQMMAMQATVVDLTQTLAERSENLAALELRIAEMLQTAGEPARVTVAGITPGVAYALGPVTATFAADGTFRMENSDSGQAVTGVYELADGILSLDGAEGDLGTAEFPMNCRIVADTGGFALTDEDGTCTLLADTSFVRAD